MKPEEDSDRFTQEEADRMEWPKEQKDIVLRGGEVALLKTEIRTAQALTKQLRVGMLAGMGILAAAYPDLLQKSIAAAIAELADTELVNKPMTMKLLDLLPKIVGGQSLQDGDTEAYQKIMSKLRAIDTGGVRVTERVIERVIEGRVNDPV